MESENKSTLTEFQNRPKTIAENLLVEAILTLQENQAELMKIKESSIDEFKKLPDYAKKLEEAGEKYIETLDEYTEIKKKEIEDTAKLQFEKLVLAVSALENTINKASDSDKKGFLRFFKRSWKLATIQKNTAF